MPGRIAGVLGYRDAHITRRDGRQGDRAQDFETSDEDVTTFIVLTHVGNLLEHGRHGAAFGGAYAALTMGAGDADDSHTLCSLLMRDDCKFFFVVSQAAQHHQADKRGAAALVLPGIALGFSNVVRGETHRDRLGCGNTLRARGSIGCAHGISFVFVTLQ